MPIVQQCARPRRPPGLYLHIPFCSSICPYCDFSVLKAGAAARRRFVEYLVAEVPLAARSWVDPRPFDTVYFGGGTPSQLPPEELGRVLEGCRRHLALPSDAWLFLEANPEDVGADVCAAWRDLGVRTVSLGVQAFSEDALRFLGRRHSGRQARDAVVTAQAAGFHTVSIDLIFGLPGQTAEAWRRELKEAVALSPGHISCYQLTIHERTRFGVAARRGQLAEMPEGEQAVLFELTHRVLADSGYAAYEVSNFARGADHQSRHNKKYWNHTPYLGLGPSAHSLALEDDPLDAAARSPRSANPLAARRSWNEKRTPRWEARIAAGERPVEADEALDAVQIATEEVMLGLRTTDGIDLGAFQARHGVDLVAANDALVERLVVGGRVRVETTEEGSRRLVPTVSGLAVADGLAAAFSIPVCSESC
jgi:oxygen-independent coproporphyrinogen-3 oxidase